MTRQVLLLLAVVTVLAAAGFAQTSGEPAEQEVAAGLEALEAGDLERAELAFRTALQKAPETEPALLGLSQVLEGQGDPVGALSLARQALESEPRSAAATLAVARYLAQLGEFQQALDSLERLRELDPDEEQGYLLAALLLRDLGRLDEAIAMLNQAVDGGLRGPLLETELAMMLIAADRPAEARQRADLAIAAHGESAGLLLAMGFATANDGSTPRLQAVPYLEHALELGVPDPAGVSLELGSLLLEEGRAPEAIEHLTRAAELSPDSPDVYYKLGTAQRATGDAEGARESLTRFQELKRADDARERVELEVGTTLNEAQSLASANRLPEALTMIEQLLDNHPNEARAHTLRAKILFSMLRPEQALKAIERARELEPDGLETNYLEGMFLLQLGQPVAARSALLRVVSLDPGLGEAYTLLGGAAAKMDNPEEAVIFFERALEAGDDSPSLRLGYAAALESLGRLDESARQEEAYRRLVQPPQ